MIATYECSMEFICRHFLSMARNPPFFHTLRFDKLVYVLVCASGVRFNGDMPILGRKNSHIYNIMRKVIRKGTPPFTHLADTPIVTMLGAVVVYTGGLRDDTLHARLPRDGEMRANEQSEQHPVPECVGPSSTYSTIETNPFHPDCALEIQGARDSGRPYRSHARLREPIRFHAKWSAIGAT